MAQTATNKLKDLLGDYLATLDLRMGLLKTLAGHTNVPDLASVAAMEAHADFAELTTGEVASYARQALGSLASTQDDTNDRANVDAANASFGNLETGGTIVGAFIYRHVTNDSDSPVLGIYDLTSTPTNGGPVSVTIADFLRIT